MTNSGGADGVVKTFYEATRTVTLDSGMSYTLADGLSAEGLAEGAKVKVAFDDGTTNATAVEAMK